MVRTPDNWEAESRKSPEYQGKTAQKLAQYGLKAARRAPQFSKRWFYIRNVQKPRKISIFRGFFFWKPLIAFAWFWTDLAQFDPVFLGVKYRITDRAKEVDLELVLGQAVMNGYHPL